MATAKFTKEQMDSIKEFQQTYGSIQQEFGNLAITKLRLSQQIDSLTDYENELTEKFKTAQNKEQEFMKQITNQYGEGTLNPKTGEYTISKK